MSAFAEASGRAARFKWLLLAAPALILASTLWCVIHNLSPLPYQDQWETVREYERALRQGLTLEALYAQHNEHRIFFPRLALFADLHLFGGSNALNIAVIFGLIFSLCALMARLAGARQLTALGVAGLAAALAVLVSLRQWENLVWGFQSQFVGVYAAGGWAAWLFAQAVRDPDRVERVRLAGALALVGVATFTMANGILAGAALVVLATLMRAPLRALAVTAAATALLGAAYFHGYHSVAGHSSISAALANPVGYIAYVALYLGNALALNRAPLAFGMGAAGMALTLRAMLLVVRDRARDPRRAALVGVMIFVGLSAAVTALGRLNLGLGQALSSRYVTPSALFWAAQLVFWSREADLSGRPILKKLAAAAVAAALGVVALGQLTGRIETYAWGERVRLASDVLLSGVRDPFAVRAVYPNDETPTELSGLLRERRLSIFRGPEARLVGRRLDQIGPGAAPARCLGAFDLRDRAPGRRATAARAEGWAWDKRAGRPVRRVLLVRTDGVVIGLASGGIARPDVQAALGERGAVHAGWRGVAPAAEAGPILAYGVLADGSVCQVGRK